MAEETRPVTEDELELFASKLTAFAAGLDAQEKAILQQMIANTKFGSASESDVEAFALRNFQQASLLSLRPLLRGGFNLGGGLTDGFWAQWSARQY